ncbi:hypothetical protein AXF42_Ash007787 [Apostasia shenzhenica]|uniref:TF-B3 domain-containing protein n=1 Tax=Apostasia shenzhenica TaxID=1088818 RepID=A0A2I0B5E2_9ASPA|nr:hypothetical protein AXF42_Ash007787 [Apostasia shenzhenica]
MDREYSEGRMRRRPFSITGKRTSFPLAFTPMAETTAPSAWMTGLAERKEGFGLRHMTTKTLQKSDVDDQLNRLLIRSLDVVSNFLPALDDGELEQASLHGLCQSKKRKRGAGETSAAGRKTAGRSHGGLEVPVFTQAGWRFVLRLTRWDGSCATVFKGPEWRLLRVFGELRAGDVVELWMFRCPGEQKPCFLLSKIQ